MGAAARTREIVLVNDVSRDPRYLPTPGTVDDHAELAVPLRLGGGVLGVLNVERRAPFGAENVHRLRIVADQLVAAIETARLHETAQRAAVLEERHRLARDLHDSVTQQLFSATLVAQAVGTAYARDRAEGERRAAMLVDLTRGALGEMGALLAELQPWEADVPNDVAKPRRDGPVAALRAYLLTGRRPCSSTMDGSRSRPRARRRCTASPARRCTTR